MLNFNRFKKSAKKLSGSMGKRLYAIGDVHGCYDEMLQLLEIIEKDNAARSPKECVIVFLGDLIDRGPKSRCVIEHLISSPPKFAKVACLKGNHEEMLITVLRDEPERISQWLTYGGNSFVESYGIDSALMSNLLPEDMQHMLIKYVPRAHIEFIDSMFDCITFGDYFLVHAGVDTDVSRDAQEPKTMRWIREPFLSFSKDIGYKVVHGHTISPEPEVKQHRIGVDTGCYETGVLTAVLIEDEEVELFSTA